MLFRLIFDNMKYSTHCFRALLCAILMFTQRSFSFWTNTFNGGNSNDLSNIGREGSSCPNWATYFEVGNTTMDCKSPVLRLDIPFQLKTNKLCERICDEVNLLFPIHHCDYKMKMNCRFYAILSIIILSFRLSIRMS